MRNWRLFEWAVLGLAAGLVAFQLFVPPSLGVADNNDFPKLIGRYCLGPADDHPLFEYVSFSYERGASHCWDSGLATSAVLPLRLALALQPRHFDLRVLGAIYGLLFLAAFHGLLRLARRLTPWSRAALPLAALLVFAGATYVPWLNSFYFDAASLVFLLLSTVWVCRVVLQERVRIGDYLWAGACVALFASSKAQHAPLALLLIPCFWLSFGRPSFPAAWLRAVVTGCILMAAAVMGVTAPRWYQSINTYNALFFQCLPRSSNPAADLASLGIDPSMLPYVGQHAFLPDSPMQHQDQLEAFGRQMSAAKLAMFYLRRPGIAAGVLGNALREASLQKVRMEIGDRAYRLGNYQRSAGYPPEAQSHFLDLWTDGKTRVLGNRPWLYAAYAIALLTALWIRASRIHRRARVLVATLAGMVLLSAVIGLFDGVDMGRHMLIFNTLLDVGVCAIFAVPKERRSGSAG